MNKPIILLLIFCGIVSVSFGQTYNKDVRPIINTNCVPCHWKEGAAPFSLTQYFDVSRKAQTIVDVITTGFMPPWMPDPAYSHFRGERGLSKKEMETIVSWVENGKKEGKSKRAKEQFIYHDTFQEDLRLTVGSINEDTNVTDLYKFFVIPIPEGEDRNIRAIKFNPGNPGIVHHAWVFSDTVGFDNHGRATNVISEFSDLGFPFTDILTAYLPGASGTEFPKSTGKKLYGGSNVVVQVHYFSPGGIFEDTTSISFHFTEDSIIHPVKTMLVTEANLENPPLRVPANKISTSILTKTVADSILVLRVGPHTHNRGKHILTFALTPNGDSIPLIRIPEWDFNWQGYYAFQKPVLIPGGSVIRQIATYDNTSNNPNNPVIPPVDVYYGLGSLNEMCELAIEFLFYEKNVEKLLEE